jgi:hypothetical protein
MQCNAPAGRAPVEWPHAQHLPASSSALQPEAPSAAQRMQGHEPMEQVLDPWRSVAAQLWGLGALRPTAAEAEPRAPQQLPLSVDRPVIAHVRHSRRFPRFCRALVLTLQACFGKNQIS